MARSHRNHLEDKARGRCREIAREAGSYIRKTEDGKHVLLGECDLWPQGLYLEFRGWVSLLETLRANASEKAA